MIAFFKQSKTLKVTVVIYIGKLHLTIDFDAVKLIGAAKGR